MLPTVQSAYPATNADMPRALLWGGNKQPTAQGTKSRSCMSLQKYTLKGRKCPTVGASYVSFKIFFLWLLSTLSAVAKTELIHK